MLWGQRSLPSAAPLATPRPSVTGAASAPDPQNALISGSTATSQSCSSGDIRCPGDKVCELPPARSLSSLEAPPSRLCLWLLAQTRFIITVDGPPLGGAVQSAWPCLSDTCAPVSENCSCSCEKVATSAHSHVCCLELVSGLPTLHDCRLAPGGAFSVQALGAAQGTRSQTQVPPGALGLEGCRDRAPGMGGVRGQSELSPVPEARSGGQVVSRAGFSGGLAPQHDGGCLRLHTGALPPRVGVQIPPS